MRPWDALLFALGGLAGAGPSITDGVVSVPVPPGWVVWSEDDVRSANPPVGNGQVVVAQCAAYPYGHPDFNSTISLAVLEASPEADPATLLADVIAQVPGFSHDSQGIAAFTIAGVPCAAAAGRFTVNLGAVPLEVVMRVIVLSTHEGARLVTALSLGAAGPWEDALTQLPRAISIVPPPLPMQRSSAQWKVGHIRLPLPAGFIRWSPAQVEEARQRAEDAAGSIIAGIQQQSPSASGFAASVAAEIKTTIPLAEVPEAVTLCQESAQRMVETIPYGTWLVRPTVFTVATHPAAYAIVQGRFPRGGDYQTLEFEHVWALVQGEPVRFLLVTEAGDLATRATLEQMLSGLVP
ncbi:MAG: hypothetical protein HUU25_07055 [Candidatus Sumerlaeia bacterium]|nr:hypothetical protein [Candidatus Sumerlaeia bacterium]